VDALQGVRRLCEGCIPQGNHQIIYGYVLSDFRDDTITRLMDLSLERLKPSENALNRVGALYGVYVFYSTQPFTSAPRLHVASGIEISFGGAFSPCVI